MIDALEGMGLSRGSGFNARALHWLHTRERTEEEINRRTAEHKARQKKVPAK